MRWQRDTIQKKGLLSRDVIKYIAAFTMLLNHIANVFLEKDTLWYEILVDIGYFTAITMLYFMVEGYEYTSSKKRYAVRLLLFAILSQIPFSMTFSQTGEFGFVSFNMLFTLLACFGIIHIFNQSRQFRYAKLCLVLLVLATCFSDWGGMAPVITILFVQAEKDRTKLKKAFFYSALLFGMINFADGLERFSFWQALLHGAGCMLPMLCSGVCILYLYNGKRMERGRNFSKWFFYVFYPSHLLILGILRIAGGS